MPPALFFNAVLRTHHFPRVWKHARVISILKPGKDPALPSSYRPINLLDTIGKLFVAKAFDTVWIDGLLYAPKVPVFHSPYNLILSQGSDVLSVLPDGHVSSRGTRVGVAQGGLISPVLFRLYVNDTPSLLHHFELALYADDTAIIATSLKPTLLLSYLELNINDLQRWLSEWRIAINVSKSTAIIFARAGRRFIQPRPVTLFRESIQWVDTTRYLGVTLDTRLI